MSNNRAPMRELSFNASNEQSSDASSSSAITQQLFIDRCYEGFNTMQAPKLWKFFKSEQDISDQSALWYLTLMKNGCYNFLKLGVDGILQAMVLSLGGLKFSNHHLELNLNPKQLHRNYYFRNLNYSNITSFNISVEVDYENHAKLYVSMSRYDSSEKFYACDAGCLDDPVQLKSNIVFEFPVKLTNPITAILYITSDQLHVSELKHILHVQEVELAPPQSADDVALHRHGHQLGGLSIIFWAIFILLLVIFHLFLFKLICRELLKSNSDDDDNESSSTSRSRYNYRYIRTRAV